MCELFGFTSEYEQDIKPYLTEFYSHGILHPHGWGIAKFPDNRIEILTEPVCANKSKIIRDIIDKMPPQKLLIGHIRLATVGNLETANCHPFTRIDNSGRQWVLAHNGTIFNGMKLLKYTETQVGSTDSERILMYCIDRINEETEQKGAPLNAYERFKVIEKSIQSISKRNKINLLIYDGEQFYIHTNMKDTLYYKKEPNSCTFATVPLDNGEWHNVPLCTLLIYQNGNLVYTGENHHNEYIESIKLINNNMNFNL